MTSPRTAPSKTTRATEKSDAKLSLYLRRASSLELLSFAACA
jgi:hypothetical protein